ncbi:26S protease regulatory subunit [Synechococcus sp. PCC 6312]|uniref:ATP-binding protein n=1 Tax=Synechococcus sp. (strain ATCC 27167 / PCC 6312) TaxID=195253 RepID=UPI00029EE7B1|nr:ATP-binding protein [Synechococcus sp. PCC 6312]AFY62020.1 AAA+ family ATPase [Synechococcus sp. PCC 6312]
MKGEVLKRLFRAVASDDSQAIQSMLSVVVEEERKLGHINLADQLESILRKSSHHATYENSSIAPHRSSSVKTLEDTASKVPDAKSLTLLSSKHRFNHPFIVTIPRDNLRHHMILSDAVEVRFRRIEREYAARDRLAHHGLRYRQKILLYGSPGCGKTMGAERIAWNTGLTLVKVRFDAMVSSYLGETATNLREVFETAAASPCLLFIDECDAIAKSREDSQEVGEIKRVVNTFLQLLDEYEVSNGLLVAATNLTKFLDEAVWRRFDDVIEVPKPTEPEIKAILKQTLSSVEVGSIDWNLIVQKMINFSAAQVVRAAQDAAKRAILDREELVIQEHLEESIQDVLASHV